MSAAVQRAVRELMEDAGFVLVREAKHLVWKRGQTMIVTSRAGHVCANAGAAIGAVAIAAAA